MHGSFKEQLEDVCIECFSAGIVFILALFVGLLGLLCFAAPVAIAAAIVMACGHWVGWW